MKGPSRVAAVNAAFRARETRRPPGDRILSDPFARRLEGGDARVRVLRAARWLVPPFRRLVEELQTVHCVRHACIDRLVLDAVAGGCRQVVLLGAGFDMRAQRFAGALEGVRWIEVDHPETAAAKRRRLRPLDGGAARVHAAPADLLAGSLLDALHAAGFDPRSSTCVVAEGLVHYLTRERFVSLLGELSAFEGGCRLVLSYIRSEVYHAAPGLLARLMRLLGEVPRLHFDLEDLAACAARAGFRPLAFLAYAEQVRMLAPAAAGRPAGVSQDVAVFERGPAGVPAQPPSSGTT